MAASLSATPLPQALKDLAARAGMPPSKAHRYLVSLIRAGLAEQDRESGHYRLGPLALQLGLAALASLDVMKLGGEAIAELRLEIDETIMFAIWGNRGPVVVRWEESSRPVVTNVRVGWVMPLLNSATGRLFAAYLPRETTEALLAEELHRTPDEGERYAARLEEIRKRGLSRVEGELLQGVAGMAAPVFDYRGAMVAAITAVGRERAMDVSWNGPVAKAVKLAAQRLSQRLGFAG